MESIEKTRGVFMMTAVEVDPRGRDKRDCDLEAPNPENGVPLLRSVDHIADDHELRVHGCLSRKKATAFPYNGSDWGLVGLRKQWTACQ
jgi:hypothetical protein